MDNYPRGTNKDIESKLPFLVVVLGAVMAFGCGFTEFDRETKSQVIDIGKDLILIGGGAMGFQKRY